MKNKVCNLTLYLRNLTANNKANSNFPIRNLLISNKLFVIFLLKIIKSRFKSHFENVFFVIKK